MPKILYMIIKDDKGGYVNITMSCKKDYDEYIKNVKEPQWKRLGLI